MNDFNKKKQMANLLREDERYLPMHLHKTIDPLFPNVVGLENQKLAIRLLETFDIGRGYYITEFLGVSKFHENAAAMGVWVEKQMREKTYLRFDEVAWQKVFQKISVDEVWGVGRKISQALRELGIDTVDKLRLQPHTAIQQQFNINLARTVQELNGVACLELETEPPTKQQIFCSRSFGKKITDLQSLKESVADYAARAASKLRQQESLTSCVYVMVQTSRFKDNYYFNSSQRQLAFPSNDTRLIISTAVRLCERLYRENHLYAKVGVGLLELSSQHQQQLDLLNNDLQTSSEALMSVMDSINQRYGSNTLFIAQQGIQKEWQMVREYKSPAYTTKFKQIPKVKL